MKRGKISFISLLIIISIIISQVLAVKNVLSEEGVTQSAKLNYTELTIAGTTGITSDISIGQLPSGVTISMSDSTIVVPDSAKFSFTSDDGSENDYRFRDVFTSRGVSCTIPVITNYISTRTNYGSISLSHLLALQNNFGYEIGSHTYSHPYLTKLTMDDVIFQLTESKRQMTDMGLNIKNVFIPYGAFTEPILDECQKVYRSTRVSLSGVNTPLDKRKLKAYWLDSGVTLAKAKQIVDTARTCNQFVIFGFHGGVASRGFMDGTIGGLIDYIHSFNDTQVLTVDKALDRLENVMVKDVDYKIVDNKIVLEKFFLRSLPIGENVLTFSFSDGSSETITINIEKNNTLNTPVPIKNVSRISITKMPNNIEYLEGESFSKEGMLITAYYQDGTSALVDDYTITGYTSTPGVKTITISYMGKNTIFTVKVIAKAEIPASVVAISTSYNSIKLTWTASVGAAGYSIYRAVSETGPYSLIASKKVTNFTDINLITGTTYYYKVSAYVTVGINKVYSNQTEAVNVEPVPKAPTTFTVSRFSSSSIRLSWYAVTGSNGYEIYRCSTLDGSYNLVTATTSTFFIDTKLIRNSIYYYKVRAYKTIGGVKIYSVFTDVKSAKPY